MDAPKLATKSKQYTIWTQPTLIMKLSRNIKQQNIRPKPLKAQETPQSQDMCYVHPSMDIPHLTLHIQECNLDKRHHCKLPLHTNLSITSPNTRPRRPFPNHHTTWETIMALGKILCKHTHPQPNPSPTRLCHKNPHLLQQVYSIHT